MSLNFLCSSMQQLMFWGVKGEGEPLLASDLKLLLIFANPQKSQSDKSGHVSDNL